MVKNNNKICFARKEFKGSRLRCLMLTALPRDQVAGYLSSLIHPYGEVTPNDQWMPRGFLEKKEAQLGTNNCFDIIPNPEFRDKLKTWWLVKGHNTPSWDIVSSCQINGNRGLIFVEAKANGQELKKTDSCTSKLLENIKRIESAILESNNELKKESGGWNLKQFSHYQLSNRFAWSWKIASFGIPVFLVYLGFLNADEMHGSFKSIAEWDKAVKAYANGFVPCDIWNQRLGINGVPFYPLIRAMDIHWEVKKL